MSGARRNRSASSSCWSALAGGRLRAWRLTRDDDPWEPSDQPGRWHSPPRRVLYASTTAALAVLEGRAHLDPDDARRVHTLVHVEFDVAAGEVACLDVDALPADWKRRKGLTRALGAAWLEEGKAGALLVPSVLAGGELNVLINPDHPCWQRWRRNSVEQDFRFDPRLTGPGVP